MPRKRTSAHVTHTSALRLLIVFTTLSLIVESKDAGCKIKPYKMELKRKVVPFDNDLEVLICLGNVTLASCEGQCVSETTPSVLSGMEKKCHCCRETKVQERKVYLSECHTLDGVMRPGKGHSVIVTEPVHCRCQQCTG
ncbi:partner of bursicon-like [Amphiura filiformis]|uniref:partner of bursicon-like n=1 Tax=Amphiura filiformis TaxID=82378 RepID=UPI003B21205D